MAKHLVDLDEQALQRARARLGTSTIKDTVNEALRRVAVHHEAMLEDLFEVLADTPLIDRADAWRR